MSDDELEQVQAKAEAWDEVARVSRLSWQTTTGLGLHVRRMVEAADAAPTALPSVS
jgi:hypothetical protein